LNAPLRSRLALALGVSAALLVAGCYSKIPEEDGGTMPSTAAPTAAAPEAKKPTMTPLEREQAAALAEQRKRVAALAETHPGAGEAEKKVEETPLASAEPKATPAMPAPRKAAPAPAEHEQATTASAVAPGAGGYWVQIGSGRDEKDSETLWERSKAAHPTILGDASHTVVRADLGAGKGVFYRVHVGPYENAAAAGALCGRLRAAHVDCFLVAPGGGIITQPEPKNASVEPTKPAETAPAKPAPAKEKATTAATPAAKPAPVEAKPTAAAPPAKAEPAKASAETETKKPESKSDVPFRTMGLPGLPD
jgi:SPOR domain